jgi:hypothetical protein
MTRDVDHADVGRRREADHVQHVDVRQIAALQVLCVDVVTGRRRSDRVRQMESITRRCRLDRGLPSDHTWEKNGGRRAEKSCDGGTASGRTCKEGRPASNVPCGGLEQPIVRISGG